MPASSSAIDRSPRRDTCSISARPLDVTTGLRSHLDGVSAGRPTYLTGVPPRRISQTDSAGVAARWRPCVIHTEAPAGSARSQAVFAEPSGELAGPAGRAQPAFGLFPHGGGGDDEQPVTGPQAGGGGGDESLLVPHDQGDVGL